LSKLYRATAVVGGATAIKIIIGVVRAKFMAATIGAYGIGIFAQANNFLNATMTFGSFGVGFGMSKYVSEYWANNDKQRVKNVFYASILLQSCISLILVLPIIFLSSKLSHYIFSDSSYSNYIILIAIGLPFLVLLSTLIPTIVGFGEYGYLAKSRIVESIIGLIILVCLVWRFGLNGGICSIVILAMLGFFITLYFLKVKMPFDLITKSNITSLDIKGVLHELKKLLKFGTVSLLVSIAGNFSLLFVRSIVIKEYGAEANGIYQVVFAISAYYFPFFTNGIWAHFLPKVSSLSSNSEISVEVNNTIRQLLLISIPVMVGILVFRKLIVSLMFSSEFLPALDLFRFQLLGDFFLLNSYILGTSLIARRKLKVYLVLGLFCPAIFLLTFYFLKEHFGLNAITISYAISHFLYFILNVSYQVKNDSLRIKTRNIVLILSSLLLISFAGFYQNKDYFIAIAIVKMFLIVVWFFYNTSSDERKEVRVRVVENKQKFLSIFSRKMN